MTKTFMIALALLTINAVSTVSVQAGSKAGASAPISEPPASQMAELTKKECTNLGGTVKTDNVCKSGKTCKMDSANGDQHFVCLESAR